MGNGTNDGLRRPRPYIQEEWGVVTPQRPDSMESQKRLEEIMQQTGILRLAGKVTNKAKNLTV